MIDAKNIAPWSLYVFFPSDSTSSTDCIFPADSQAYDSADIITPVMTASAKLSVNTVITATDIPTIISGIGTLPNNRNEPHSKVPITTIIMTPIRTATGIISMYLER